MALHRVTSQIPADQKYIQTIVATMWLYPPSDFEAALATTTYQYTYDGVFITCPDISTLEGLYTDIFNKTAQSQPIGNVGFSLGVGTILENFGKKLYFQVPSGNTVIEWTLVKQLTPQSALPSGGNSPDGTVGYIITYNYIGSTPVFEGPYVTFI
jgi:hypothetical protein